MRRWLATRAASVWPSGTAPFGGLPPTKATAPLSTCCAWRSGGCWRGCTGRQWRLFAPTALRRPAPPCPREGSTCASKPNFRSRPERAPRSSNGFSGRHWPRAGKGSPRWLRETRKSTTGGESSDDEPASRGLSRDISPARALSLVGETKEKAAGAQKR